MPLFSRHAIYFFHFRYAMPLYAFRRHAAIVHCSPLLLPALLLSADATL